MSRLSVAPRRSLALALTAVASGCLFDPADTTRRREEGFLTASEVPVSPSSELRAAAIAAMQRGAGEAYAARLEPRGLVARAGPLDVRYGLRGAHLETAGAEAGTLALQAFGCADDEEPAAIVSSEPRAVGNRVSYASTAAGVAIDAWYLSGPLGLEHGFTVAAPPPCAQRGGTLELHVETNGFRVEPTPRGASLVGASGQRLAYTDLLAKDASGRVLPSSLRFAHDDRLAIRVDVTGASWPVEIDPLVSTEEQELTASDGAPEDLFGYVVALSGDTAVIAAPSHDVGGNANQGAAYVFVRTNGLWVEQQQLVASDGAAGNGFGRAMAMSGDWLLLGAPGATVNGNAYQGAAYLFHRTNGTWSEHSKLVGSLGKAEEQFGDALALRGSTAMIAAPYEVVDGNMLQGSVYVFEESNGVWTERQKLLALDGGADDYFGYSLVIDGDTAFITASEADVGPVLKAGAVYVFQRVGDTWFQQQRLVSSAAESNTGFGSALALRGDTALLAGVFETVGQNACQGAVYVFTRANGLWSEQQKLTVPDGKEFDVFGISVALSDGVALIGAASADVGDQFDQGSVYVFEQVDGVWTLRDAVRAMGGTTTQAFGISVSIDSQSALIGAFNPANSANEARGAAYVFQVAHANGDPCESGVECSSGFCADGVCCDTACGDGVTDDCQACSVSAGAAMNGACESLSGSACSDGNACTSGDACVAGSCVADSALDCDDAQDCTVDSCDVAGGCLHTPAPDGTPCSEGACQASVCEASASNATGGEAGGDDSTETGSSCRISATSGGATNSTPRQGAVAMLGLMAVVVVRRRRRAEHGRDATPRTRADVRQGTVARR
jgi:MYXO-CTERM domain-containing protein